MTTEHLASGSRFAVHSHALAGTVTVATWFVLCTGFGLEVAPARDPVARLYQMEATRDALARPSTPAKAAPAGPASANHKEAKAADPEPIPGS